MRSFPTLGFQELGRNTFGDGIQPGAILRPLGSYSPLDEGGSGEKFWYDFSNVTEGLADSAAITTRIDKSGNGHTLTFDATKQPLNKNNILNGLSGALFDNTNDAGYTPTYAWGSNKASIGVVFSGMASGSDRCLIEFGNASSQNGSWLVYRQNTNNQLVGLARGNGLFSNVFSPNGTPIHTAAYFVAVVFDLTASQHVRMYVNGVDVSTAPGSNITTAPNFDNKVLNVGGRANGTSLPTNAYIHEDFGVAAALDAAAIARWTTYVLGRWGGPPFSFGVGDHADNAYTVIGNRSDAGTFVQASPASRIVVSTDADWCFVESYNDLGAANGFGDIGVRVNGADVQAFENTATAKNIYSVPLGTKGVLKTVDLINGIQSMQSGVRKGEWITGAQFNGAATVISASELTTPRILVYGDSIAGGQSATNPSLQGWLQLVRNAYAATGSVISEAWGNRKLKDDAETPAQAAAFAAQIAVSNPTIIWLAIGTNDVGTWTAADFETAYGNLLDEINALLPGAVVYAQTPILKTTDTGMPDLRTAIGNAQSTRAAFCTLVDGTDVAFPQPADLTADGLHPTTAGQLKYSNAVRGVLGI